MQEGRHAHNNESTSMNGINFFFVVALLLIVYLTHLIFIYNNKYCLHFAVSPQNNVPDKHVLENVIDFLQR
jgi:hypothetical protein